MNPFALPDVTAAGRCAQRPPRKSAGGRGAADLLTASAAVRGLLLAALCAAALPSAAQTQWKWRDAAGRIQYSDRPPPTSVPDKDVLTRPQANALPAPRPPAAASEGSAASAAANRGVEPALDEKRRQAEAAEAAKRKAEEEKTARQRQENCQRARDYARTIESGIRISRVNAQGEREFMDDAQRAKELSRAREVMASDCR